MTTKAIKPKACANRNLQLAGTTPKDSSRAHPRHTHAKHGAPNATGHTHNSPTTAEPILEQADPCTENELVLRVAQGDREAFDALYKTCRARVSGMVSRMIGDRSETEDVVQDVFLQVWNRASRFRPDKSSAITWILMIARCRAIDKFRRRSTERQRLKSLAWHHTDHVESGSDKMAIDGERARQALFALRNLPPKQREPLILAFRNGLSTSQIAKHERIPIGTAKTRAHLGMARLRYVFGRDADEWAQHSAVA